MNNEPVAYVDPIWMDRPDLVMSHQLEIGKLFARTQFTNYVPLYTHPVSKAKDRFTNYESICLECGTTIYKPLKELTDEEIDAVGDKVSNLIDTYAGRREFARAILRKAKEK